MGDLAVESVLADVVDHRRTRRGKSSAWRGVHERKNKKSRYASGSTIRREIQEIETDTRGRRGNFCSMSDIFFFKLSVF